MRDAILAIGASWYTAWIDAGQPDLAKLSDQELSDEDLREMRDLELQYRGGEIKGREH